MLLEIYSKRQFADLVATDEEFAKQLRKLSLHSRGLMVTFTESDLILCQKLFKCAVMYDDDLVPIGWATVNGTNKTATINAYVKVSWRKQGHGRALVDALRDATNVGVYRYYNTTSKRKAIEKIMLEQSSKAWN